jgi:hypothetical protein
MNVEQKPSQTSLRAFLACLTLTCFPLAAAQWAIQAGTDNSLALWLGWPSFIASFAMCGAAFGALVGRPLVGAIAGIVVLIVFLVAISIPTADFDRTQPLKYDKLSAECDLP